MCQPRIVFVHTNDASYRPLETCSIAVVLAKLGGESLPFSVVVQLKTVPEVVIIHDARWPQWPEALQSIRAMWRDTPVIGILEEQTIASPSVRNVLSGALSDFLCEPVRETELYARVERLLQTSGAHQTLPRTRAFKVRHHLESLLGDNELFVQALKRVPVLAAVDATVLIYGETGTGKELVARALHYGGLRHQGPFVPCNCGALPDHLFENELFGHAAGAYTDARSEQKGLLAIAEGGTLFLDEIDSLSLGGQVKLLRFLQDREYRPLGSSQVHRANVRILAATNVKLADLVARKLFREDLFHRLNVLQINLPPLRNRMSDVAGLAQAFLKRFATQSNRPELRFSAGAFQAMQSYDWPGNVRELESVVQRAAILSESLLIEASDLELPDAMCGTPSGVGLEHAKRQAMEGFERGYLVQLLSEQKGNVSRAAQQAGKDRRSFQRLLRRYELAASDYRD